MKTNHNELMNQLLRLERLLRWQQGMAFRRFGPQGNPLKGQGRVLSLLKLQPTITQKELGYLLDMRNQSLGELLAKLEKNEFLTRTPSQEDRRTMVITLTEAGAQAADAQPEAGEMEQIFDCLNPQEQANLSDYLERLIASLEAQGMTESDTDLPFGMECHRHWHGSGEDMPRPPKPPRPPREYRERHMHHGGSDGHRHGGHRHERTEEPRKGPRAYHPPQEEQAEE